MSGSRKRLPTPENWPTFNDLYDNKVRENTHQSSVPLPGLQQPAARMTPANQWDVDRTVELNIETDWKFKFTGPHSALLSTYNSLAMMMNLLFPNKNRFR